MKLREWLPRAWGNGGRWLLIAAVFFAATFGTLLAVVVWDQIQPDSYNPLGAYPTQQVNEAEVNGIPTVVASPGATVSVTGTKCNDSDQSVKARGHFEFRRAKPPGFVVPVGSSTVERPPGCQTFTFANEVPAAVIAEINAHGASLWQITGVETPISDDGQRGTPRYWNTVSFRLVPDALAG